MERITINTFGLDIGAIRNDFPILQKEINGKPIIYFNSVGSDHKPENIDGNSAALYEQELLKYATEKLSTIESLKIVENNKKKEPVISFDLEGTDLKELESYLSLKWNIAVGADDLSAQAPTEESGVKSLISVSFCYYNTQEEIDILCEAIQSFIDQKRLDETAHQQAERQEIIPANIW